MSEPIKIGDAVKSKSRSGLGIGVVIKATFWRVSVRWGDKSKNVSYSTDMSPCPDGWLNERRHYPSDLTIASPLELLAEQA